MRKDFGPQTWILPMPVLVIATYGDDGTADVMPAAWGTIYDYGKILIALAMDHKTVKNLKKTKAFTVSVATKDQLEAIDYAGIVSGNNTPDKMERTGFTLEKSKFVNAPLIQELPVTLECELQEITSDDCAVIGKIVNASAEESVLDESGKPDLGKVQPVVFDSVKNEYYALGDVVGKAFRTGAGRKG
ncbi:MAG: flavin reductase family protein [Succiniclasticum sp.]|jgi:flavin reductase (DIM6/NTAB) family NADH-FMN oxidoreductase RutF|nr:flavin reductase family protein [Succiniclasticum sp.]MEE3478973.1 flavin reductase family protein [Succiniclasticum sp.]